MKTNNKGYSLVELILTMACFSIIMAAIVLIMRTTIATYKDGLFETKKQQEAQIVANQVSEFIIDAKAYNGGYSFTNDGSTKTFVFDGSKKTLCYQYTNSYGDAMLVPISDCITEFKIEGLESAVADEAAGIDIKSKEYDNACRVKVTIEYQDRTYTAIKDVHFRNNLEYPDEFNIGEGNVASPTPDPIGAGKEVTVLRYETIDLTKKYGVISYTKEGPIDSWYVVDDADGDSTTGHGITIKCNSTLNGAFDQSIGSSKGCVLNCTLSGSKTLKLIFTTDAVDWDLPENPIFTDYYEKTTNEGFHQDLPIKGIHINEFLKAQEKESMPKTITYYSSFEVNGTEVGKSKDVTLAPNKPVSGALDNWQASGDARMDFSYNGQSTRLVVGIVPNAFSNGFCISTANEKHNDDYTGKGLRNGKGDKHVVFYVTIGSKTMDPARFRYYMAGSSLKEAIP